MEKNDLRKLDTYQMVIDENDEDNGVFTAAFTSTPAIERLGVFLSTDKAPVKLSFDKPKQVITSSLLIPGKPIYRYDAALDYEYNIIFSEEGINKIMKNAMRKHSFIFTTNLEHETPLNGPRIIESWIVEDPQKDKSVALGMDPLPKGTWVVSYYIPDIHLYNDLKNRNVGLSIEGYFTDIKLPESAKEKIIKQSKTTSTMNENLFTMINNKLNKLLKASKVEMVDFTTKEGQTLNVDDTTGVATIAGQPAPDAVYELEDGSTITVKDSIAINMQPAPVDNKINEEQIETPASEVVEPATNEVEVEASTEIDELKAKVEELTKALADTQHLKQANEALLSEIAALKEKNENLSTENVRLSKQPAAQPINVTPASKNVDISTMPLHERMAYQAMNGRF